MAQIDLRHGKPGKEFGANLCTSCSYIC